MQGADPADPSRSGGGGGAVWEMEDREASLGRGVLGPGSRGTDAVQGLATQPSGVSENAW